MTNSEISELIFLTKTVLIAIPVIMLIVVVVTEIGHRRRMKYLESLKGDLPMLMLYRSERKSRQ